MPRPKKKNAPPPPQRGTPPDWAVVTEADRQALAVGYFWDQAEAERVIGFAEKYIVPKYCTSDFKLFEWQKRYLMRLYGWRSPDGTRRFATALLHVAKKNGKTLLVSVIAEYELFAGRVPSPLVVSASTTRKNAGQVFDQIRSAVLKNKKLKALVRVVPSEKLIRVDRNDGEYWSMSSDASNAEGWNISCGIVDECHAHRSPKLFNALEYGTSGRVNGLLVIISTAGEDLTHFYFDIVQRGRNVLAGTDTDPTILVEVFEVDPDKDDLDDPASWRKANPSLDLYPGFTSEKFRLAWEAARKTTAKRLNFLRYRFNVFCRAEEGGWIDLAKWDLCRADNPPSEAELLAAPCFIGFDGSQTIDPTSVSATWLLPGPRFFVRSWCWVAAVGVAERERTNLPKYQQFAAAGHMTITDGDLIDKAAVRKHILGIRAAGHRVKMVVMDANGHQVFGAELEGEGFTVYRMPQSFREYTEPLAELEAAVIGKRLIHDGNTWLRWSVNAVRIKTDDRDNGRPVKAKSADHIDGAVSLLMSFKPALAASAEVKPKLSVYDRQGVQFW